MLLETARFEEWAIVEVLGHHKYVGYVTEQTLAGGSFLRVDVPEAPATEGTRYTSAQDAQPAFTKYVGPGSVYAITPVTEAFARAAVARLRAKPHNIYMPELFAPDPPKALPPGSAEATEDADDVEFGMDDMEQDAIANWEPRNR